MEEMKLVRIENNKITLAEEFKNFREKVIKFQEAELEINLELKKLKEELKEAMESCGIETFITDGFSAKIKKSYLRKGVDSKKLQTEYPDVYDDVLKETKVSSSISIEVA